MNKTVRQRSDKLFAAARLAFREAQKTMHADHTAKGLLRSGRTIWEAGDHLLYRLPTSSLEETLLDLWEASPPDKRWTAMEYVIDGDRFTTHFSFDRLDPKVSTIDRRQVILDRRYGNKQVVYPSIR